MGKNVAELASVLRANIGRVIVGKEKAIDFVLTALIAGGHVLLEDVPGTGKTVLAKALARSLDGEFKRIQFTPDLLPADVTGLSVFDQKQDAFVFRPGPVFCDILLADEINRATPRTQSALLECMEESTVTADGVTRALGSLFFVVATQNPIETQGTFPLPEAQLDRFLLQLSLGYPSGDEALRILDRFILEAPLDTLTPVAATKDLLAARSACRTVTVSDPVRRYLIDVVEATRVLPDVSLGVSPRGMLALLRAAQVYAAINGRDYVKPDDVRALTVPVCGHRIQIKAYGPRGPKTAEMLKAMLNKIPVPTEDPNRRSPE